MGKFRTDGQGIVAQEPVVEPKKNMEAKKLNPDSAAARRRKAAKRGGDSPTHAGPSDSDPAPLASEMRAQHHSAGAAPKPATGKMKDFETSFSDLFAFKGASGGNNGNGRVGKGGNEKDPLSFSNMGTVNEAKDAFPAFGGEEAPASFPEQTNFTAFSAGNQKEGQQMAGDLEEGSERAKQEANTINSKERRSRSDQPAKMSEPPHPSGDDSPAGKGKKRGSGIKGLFKKGAKDEP